MSSVWCKITNKRERKKTTQLILDLLFMNQNADTMRVAIWNMWNRRNMILMLANILLTTTPDNDSSLQHIYYVVCGFFFFSAFVSIFQCQSPQSTDLMQNLFALDSSDGERRIVKRNEATKVNKWEMRKKTVHVLFYVCLMD